ncbi:MAG: hypothetical protein J6W96_02740 [Alphaproteobacteria bacterium]|nr:hypothetical protein [Alphaproteobacteria bacterium]
MFLKKKKKEKMKVQDFYPKKEMFHYINHDFFNEDNNSIIMAQFFNKNIGYYPNINYPQTLNEKILWLNQYYHNPLMTRCADKYSVKDYIKEQLGEDLYIPTLKTYNSIYEINLDELPEKFVLKVNWGREKKQTIVIKDKKEASIDKIRMNVDDWIQPWNNFYYVSYDWAYKNMKPIIYAEKYMPEIDKQINNYKIYCYNGKAKMALVNDNKLKKNKFFVDNDWNILSIKRIANSEKYKLARPKVWDQLINMAEKLSKPFPFVQIDFYMINDKPYIKDMTFYPKKDFLTRELDEKLGADLQLPEKML